MELCQKNYQLQRKVLKQFKKSWLITKSWKNEYNQSQKPLDTCGVRVAEREGLIPIKSKTILMCFKYTKITRRTRNEGIYN